MLESNSEATGQINMTMRSRDPLLDVSRSPKSLVV